MSVYVDDMQASFGRMIMCHMVADTLEELHAMAARLGLRREWFQDDSDHPHYDVSLGKRGRAVQLGAVQITTRQLAMMMRERRRAQ
jgi:hypothetical protein